MRRDEETRDGVPADGDGVVPVVGAPTDTDHRAGGRTIRPGLLVVSVVSAGLLALLLLFLVPGEGRLPTSEDAVDESPPADSVVDRFFSALNEGDAAAAEALIAPDAVVLQLPDPLARGFGGDSARGLANGGWPHPEDLRRHLAGLVALQPDVTVETCSRETPVGQRGRELYDYMLACRVEWQDELRRLLDDQRAGLLIDVGVSGGLIRGFFLTGVLTSTDVTLGGFLPWLEYFHPAVNSELWPPDDFYWDSARVKGVDELSAQTLFALAREYADWDPQHSAESPLARIGHSLVYDHDRGAVLMLGGSPNQFYWAPPPPSGPLWEYDAAGGAWALLAEDPWTDVYVHSAVWHPGLGATVALVEQEDGAALWLWTAGSWSGPAIGSTLPVDEDGASCPDSASLLPMPGSGLTAVVDPCGAEAWLFDVTSGQWQSSAEIRDAYRSFYLQLQAEREPGAPDRFVPGDYTLLAADGSLYYAGSGTIGVMELPGGSPPFFMSGGPAEVSAAVVMPPNDLLLIGDRALWSVRIEDDFVEHLLDLAAPEDGGMYWRTAAAAYDEAAGLVVIFDGEHTWTYDPESAALEFIAGS